MEGWNEALFELGSPRFMVGRATSLTRWVHLILVDVESRDFTRHLDGTVARSQAAQLRVRPRPMHTPHQSRQFLPATLYPFLARQTTFQPNYDPRPPALTPLRSYNLQPIRAITRKQRRAIVRNDCAFIDYGTASFFRSSAR